jgi:hypothetical protein
MFHLKGLTGQVRREKEDRIALQVEQSKKIVCSEAHPISS